MRYLALLVSLLLLGACASPLPARDPGMAWVDLYTPASDLLMAEELDGKRLNDWISELLRVKGGDIYRMKGVLAVKGTNKRLVFQGVHMLMDATVGRPWKDQETRDSRFVLIGRNLDAATLKAGFQSCLAP